MINGNAHSSSITVTNRKDRSFISAVIYALIRPFGSKLVKTKCKYSSASPRLAPPSKAKRACNIHERKVDDIWIYDITLKKPPPSNGKQRKQIYRIYYFAGGGWQMPPSPSHWKFLLEILKELPDAIITLISYPLAPASAAPATFPQLLKLYNTLLSTSARDHEIVTLAGDSAGGNIALALPLEALRLDQNGPRPHSIMAICPSVDMCRDSPDLEWIAKHDPILRMSFINSTARIWRGDWDKKDPRVSPLRADVSVFQKADVLVDGVTSGYDLLGPDGVQFREKCGKAGVQGEWLEWDKMMHCWPLAKTYGIFPESEEAFRWIVQVLKTRANEEA